jgi:tetratricopeptide (TPR) repeat protein
MDLQQLAHEAEAHVAAGQTAEAATIYERMLSLAPENSDIHHMLGLAYEKLSRPEEARRRFQAAIDKNPGCSRFHRSMGDLLYDQGDYTAAEKYYRQALSIADEAETLLNLGNALHKSGKSEEALSCYRRILAAHPQHHQALNNIGKTLYDRGDPAASITWYDKALQNAPDYAEAHFNRAVTLLLSGDFKEGWPAYEWRFRREEARRVYPHRLASRRWDGSTYSGERLLVHCEQGYGDTIQFGRYLPMVKSLGGTLLFEVQEALLPLFSKMKGVDEALPFNARKMTEIRHHRHIPMLTLPAIFGTRLGNIPAAVPYLHPDPLLLSKWGKTIGGDGLRVGIVWSGSAVDPLRDCPLSAWRPLFGLPGTRFFSLQKKGAEQAAGFPLTRLDDQLADFGETAAAIGHLDLVISVDTAVAHLAGAMSKPVWVLLPFIPDWRWLLGREDSPWYPTARLFRQKSDGDWSRVIDEVAAALRRQTASRAGYPSNDPRPFADASVLSDTAQSFYSQGVASADRSDFKVAIKLFQQAIAIQPHWAEAHFNLGHAYHHLNALTEAVSSYQSALRVNPKMEPALSNLALAFQQNGQAESAVDTYTRLIELHRGLAAAFNNLGVIREQQGHTDDATEYYRCALRVDPAFADAHYNLGNLHLNCSELNLAVERFQAALKSDQGHVKAYANLGFTYHRLGMFEQSLTLYDRAIALKPDYPEAHLNRAVTRLLLGDWSAGWADFEWRFHCKDWRRTYPHRLYGEQWNGQPFPGKTVLVHSEQGIGDAILFARYLPLVKARGGRVIFEARASLLSAFQGLSGVDELIELSADKSPARHYDFYIPLCSLPRVFDTHPQTVPNQTPYLKADPEKVDQWRRRLPKEGLNVGLVWGGNDTYKERSCELVDFIPLAFVKGINWIGLQKGPAARQIGSARFPVDFKVDNWGEAFVDFSDTAAALMTLDLIITIDTSVAHMAGALNRPTWVLLPMVPDWRWLLERSQTPWYPGMRLFRQTRRDGWAPVMARVSSALENWRRGRGA